MNLYPWHFARDDLAKQTLSLLTTGPAQALTLFAPRRTGKTEFLLKDLGPLADGKGHRVVYASFWRAPLSPLAVLLHALETSRRKGSFADRVRTMLQGLAPKLKLSAPMGDASAEIDMTALAGKPPADLLLYLGDLLQRLANRAKPTLLMLDEVQELARDKDNHELVAALRTALDTHSDGLKTVFTGSSREGLRAMFSFREAPFFHFATPIDLPPLGEAFVRHLLSAFQQNSGRKLEFEQMKSAFEIVHRNPYFFRRLLEVMLLNSSLELDAALAEVRGRIEAELAYPETWLALSEFQRAVAAMLARGEKKPFSKNARATVGRMNGQEPPTAWQVQAAMRKLEREGLADKSSGGWALEDPEFAAWILAQE